MSSVESVARYDHSFVTFDSGENDVAKGIDLAIFEVFSGAVVGIALFEAAPDEPRDLIEAAEKHD